MQLILGVLHYRRPKRKYRLQRGNDTNYLSENNNPKSNR